MWKITEKAGRLLYKPADKIWTKTYAWKDVKKLDEFLNTGTNYDNWTLQNKIFKDKKDKVLISKSEKKEDKEDTCDKIPAGIYENILVDHQDYLSPMKLRANEDILKLVNLNSIVSEVEKFKNARYIYKELEMLYKRGCLLYGPPGTGKSTALHQILTQLNLKDCVCIWLDCLLSKSFINELKTDDRFKIVIFEELTELVENYSKNSLLNFLDGENSLDACLVLATTNYPELLGAQFVKRPGRFDVLFRVGYLQKQEIKMYLEHFLGKDIDISMFDQSITVAELKEIVVRVKRDNISIIEAKDAIKKYMTLADRDFRPGGGVGFLSNNDD